MYGLGILRGLGVVFKHFVESYADDLRWLGKRYYNPQALAVRQGVKGQGIFTVQYPEEKLPTPEEFRYIPFLLYEEKAGGIQEDRCTSCGICAKVCPPQCIWIERTNDPKTGRPVPAPKQFYIDIDICMNCGFCAEYCPFDAIKMDHDYEISSYDRTTAHIFDKAKLSKPVSYYASIRPTNYAREEAARAEEEAKKAAKAAAKPAAGAAGAEKKPAPARPAPAARPAATEKKE
jgi:NADH-quinone oxidoreductase subunit I